MPYLKSGLTAIFGLWIGLCIFHSGFTHASDGRFVGIGSGISKLDIDDSAADRIDDSGSYMKIIGDFPINNNFAMEYGYVDFGSFSAHYSFADETVTADGYALFVSTIGKILIAQNFSLLGKIGLDYWSEDINADFDFGTRPQSASGHGSGVNPLFGIGMQYDIAQNLSIRVELENYQDIDVGVDLATNGLDSIELSKKDIKLIGAAVLYAF